MEVTSNSTEDAHGGGLGDFVSGQQVQSRSPALSFAVDELYAGALYSQWRALISK